MDAELRKRDQNLEEALRLIDEEWKSIWETREREPSEELRQEKMPSSHISSGGTMS